HFDGRARRRLERYELEHLLGAEFPFPDQIAYCLDPPESAPRRLWRAYLPGSRTPTAKIVKSIRREHGLMERRGGEAARWVRLRPFAWAVLVESEPRAAAIRKALGPSELLNRCHIGVFLAPAPRTLLRTLHARASDGGATGYPSGYPSSPVD